MMLKNVVLPAPFGPIRLTIEPSGMSKLIEFTARRPPNRFVTFRAESSRRESWGAAVKRVPPRVRERLRRRAPPGQGYGAPVSGVDWGTILPAGTASSAPGPDRRAG